MSVLDECWLTVRDDIVADVIVHLGLETVKLLAYDRKWCLWSHDLTGSLFNAISFDRDCILWLEV